ncbi:hypothetical protein DFH11DRAFT_1543141 [Phellopilus nigrolimitatus]|nr:hypothetical protein DFH11DRAFT_1543141 [Phellopilus nigrolimitatus]
MHASPAVTAEDLRLDSRDLYAFDIQAFNAFWRQEGHIYICLFASFCGDQGSSMMVMTYSFTPQIRIFGIGHRASLQLDGDIPRHGIVSSPAGRLAVPGLQGLYGSDIHRIFRDGPNDRLCRKVLPRGIDCCGMDPYSGAILWMEKRSSPTEVGISYFD